MLFCVAISHAQMIFEKGYFINNAGVKTSCYVEDAKKTPEELHYKIQSDTEEILSKNITEIQEFGIDSSMTFRRFKVRIDRSSDDVNKLGKSKSPVFSEETLFLKLLVSGEASLYAIPKII